VAFEKFLVAQSCPIVSLHFAHGIIQKTAVTSSLGAGVVDLP
jgi:hypothetical protein